MFTKSSKHERYSCLQRSLLQTLLCINNILRKTIENKSSVVQFSKIKCFKENNIFLSKNYQIL